MFGEKTKSGAPFGGNEYMSSNHDGASFGDGIIDGRSGGKYGDQVVDYVEWKHGSITGTFGSSAPGRPKHAPKGKGAAVFGPKADWGNLGGGPGPSGNKCNTACTSFTDGIYKEHY